MEIVQSSFSDNKYYVAIKYINLPLAKKIKLLTDNILLIKKCDNKYLNQTQLLNELRQEFGFYPKISIHNHNILIGNQVFALTEKDYTKLFANTEHKDIKLNMKNNLIDGEFYFMKIEIFKKGYLNIFQIYQNGETALLLSNKEVKENSNFTYPNQEIYYGLEAIIPRKQDDASRDLTIISLCENQIDFTLIDSVSQNIYIKSKTFDTLLNLIKKCTVLSQVLNIKEKTK